MLPNSRRTQCGDVLGRCTFLFDRGRGILETTVGAQFDLKSSRTPRRTAYGPVGCVGPCLWSVIADDTFDLGG